MHNGFLIDDKPEQLNTIRPNFPQYFTELNEHVSEYEKRT